MRLNGLTLTTFLEQLRATLAGARVQEIDTERAARLGISVADLSYLVRLPVQPRQYIASGTSSVTAVQFTAARLTARRPTIVRAIGTETSAVTAFAVRAVDPITGSRAAMAIETWAPDAAQAVAEVGIAAGAAPSGLQFDLSGSHGITVLPPIYLEPGQTLGVHGTSTGAVLAVQISILFTEIP